MKRRQFLTGGAVLTASGIGVAGSMLPGATPGPGDRPLVVLKDIRMQLDPQIVRRLFVSGVEVIPLTEDPVRLWRSDAAELLRRPETRLLGVTGWADYLMVRGLAADSRRYVRSEHHHPESGTFTWLIA